MKNFKKNLELKKTKLNSLELNKSVTYRVSKSSIIFFHEGRIFCLSKTVQPPPRSSHKHHSKGKKRGIVLTSQSRKTQRSSGDDDEDEAIVLAQFFGAGQGPAPFCPDFNHSTRLLLCVSPGKKRVRSRKCLERTHVYNSN